MNPLVVKFSLIKDAPNIIFLDESSEVVDVSVFEEELKEGYRGGIILIPVSNAIQLQVAVNTPYHKDHYGLDPGFVLEKYNDFLRKKSEDLLELDPERDEFLIGEIIYE